MRNAIVVDEKKKEQPSSLSLATGLLLYDHCKFSDKKQRAGDVRNSILSLLFRRQLIFPRTIVAKDASFESYLRFPLILGCIYPKGRE
jgi:hypothetical protein